MLKGALFLGRYPLGSLTARFHSTQCKYLEDLAHKDPGPWCTELSM